MAESIIKLTNKTLPGLSRQVHYNELRRSLKALEVNAGTNYAVYDKSVPTPDKDILILPSPAVGPAGSSKICDGQLLIDGAVIGVTAFRLA